MVAHGASVTGYVKTWHKQAVVFNMDWSDVELDSNTFERQGIFVRHPTLTNRIRVIRISRSNDTAVF